MSIRFRFVKKWQRFMRHGVTLALFAVISCAAAAQKSPEAPQEFRADRMDTVLYGAAYYPE